MKYNEIDIYEFLSDYKDKNIIYIPNPGNAGDQLIAYTTIQIFQEININFTFGNIKTVYKNKILFYGGGGNLIGIYKDCYKFLVHNMYTGNHIVLLPHTVKDEDDIIRSLGDNVKIICRELVSYKYVYSIIKNKSNVYLSRDLAFHVKGMCIEVGKGTCNVFRNDTEKTCVKIPKDNVDLSEKLYKIINDNNIEILKEVSMSIFKYLSDYEIINTNRLHIAIAGSLLNKKVNFYNNSYYKNRAVYEYSMKEFKNTTFCE
jgi:exopolysaccharide biosynthesis predicted pyruvyltransferase EpsI